MKVFIRSPVNTLHKDIVLSADPDAKYYSIGENATLVTYFLWPLRVLSRFPENTLHKPIVLSSDPVAKYSSSGE